MVITILSFLKTGIIYTVSYFRIPENIWRWDCCFNFIKNMLIHDLVRGFLQHFKERLPYNTMQKFTFKLQLKVLRSAIFMNFFVIHVTIFYIFDLYHMFVINELFFSFNESTKNHWTTMNAAIKHFLIKQSLFNMLSFFLSSKLIWALTLSLLLKLPPRNGYFC